MSEQVSDTQQQLRKSAADIAEVPTVALQSQIGQLELASAMGFMKKALELLKAKEGAADIARTIIAEAAPKIESSTGNIRVAAAGSGNDDILAAKAAVGDFGTTVANQDDRLASIERGLGDMITGLMAVIDEADVYMDALIPHTNEEAGRLIGVQQQTVDTTLRYADTL